MKDVKRYTKFLKALLAVVLVAGLFWIADLSKIANNILKADLRMYLVGALLFLATYIPASLRWKSLSQSIGYRMDLNTSFRIIAVSYSFNKLLPGNSGDVLRSKIFQRYRNIDGHGNILGIVALERFLDVIGLGFIISISFFFVATEYLAQVKWLLIPFIALALIFGLLLFLHQELMEQITGMVPVADSFVSDVMDGYRSCSKEELAENLFYSLGIWGLEALSFFFFIKALNLSLTFWDGAMVTSLMSLVSGLPITPGGLGAVDATGTGLLVFSGLTASAGFTLVLMQRSIGLVFSSIIGAAIYILEEINLI